MIMKTNWKTMLLTAVAATAITQQALAVPARVMMLGDSLTAQGEGRKVLNDRLMAEGYAVEFVGSQGAPPLRHEGHGGFTIGPDQSEPGSLFANVDAWVPAAQPDVIMLLVGNNDYNGKPGVDPTRAPERLAALLDKITTLAPQATVVVGSVLKIAWADNYAGALNREIPEIVKRQQAAGRKVLYADLHDEVDLKKGAPPYKGPDGDFVDGTHLNASGAKKLGDSWYAHLQPLLAKP